jgi:hypothetical protein
MAKNLPAMYDVCTCNHEAMSHTDRVKQCYTNVPVRQQGFRGGFPIDWETEKCNCKKFLFSQENTANPKPSIQGDNDE